MNEKEILEIKIDDYVKDYFYRMIEKDPQSLIGNRLILSAVEMFGEGMKEVIYDDQYLTSNNVKYLAQHLNIAELMDKLVTSWVSLKKRKVGDIKFLAYTGFITFMRENEAKQIRLSQQGLGDNSVTVQKEKKSRKVSKKTSSQSADELSTKTKTPPAKISDTKAENDTKKTANTRKKKKIEK